LEHRGTQPDVGSLAGHTGRRESSLWGRSAQLAIGPKTMGIVGLSLLLEGQGPTTDEWLSRWIGWPVLFKPGPPT
jgi:hypothetical protein